MLRWLAVPLVVVVLACASAPPPDRSEISGVLTLFPHPALQDRGPDGYGDRRLRSARLFDYSQPGFSVVYLSPHSSSSGSTTAAEASNEARFEIRGDAIRPRFEPGQIAIGIGGLVRVRNSDDSAHVFSCPRASLIQPLAAGEEVQFVARQPGEHRMFLADISGAEGSVFSAPGPFTVPSSSGRFSFSDLEPGAWTLQAWHPRLPPTSREVMLTAGERLQVVVSLGVGRAQESRP